MKKPWPTRMTTENAREAGRDPRLPTTTDKPQTPQIMSAQAAKIVDDIVMQSQKLAEAQEKIRALDNRVEELIRENAFLTDRLQTTEQHCAFHQKHSVALHIRLTDVVGDCEHIIARLHKALLEAKHEAEATNESGSKPNEPPMSYDSDPPDEVKAKEST